MSEQLAKIRFWDYLTNLFAAQYYNVWPIPIAYHDPANLSGTWSKANMSQTETFRNGTSIAFPHANDNIVCVTTWCARVLKFYSEFSWSSFHQLVISSCCVEWRIYISEQGHHTWKYWLKGIKNNSVGCLNAWGHVRTWSSFPDAVGNDNFV